MMQSNMLPGGRELAEEPGEAAMSGTIAPQDLLEPALPQMTNGGSNDAQESMAEPELLALIIELRLRAGRGSSNQRDKSSSLLSNGSRSASTSAVDTLDLCHRKIEKLPYEMVNIIKDDVVRLALGYNLITSLPSNFIDLARLRYLNVRANLMNTFPSVLCTLPSLEILDISRNKIRKLPSEPGRLLELKVLSMSNNRLRKLPVWLPRQRDLRILKLEGNPISWPPTHISVMAPLDKAVVAEVEEKESDKEAGQLARKKAEERQMSLYISKLKAWIEENKDKIKGDQEEYRLPARSPEEELRAAAEMDESAVGDPVLTALSPKTSPAQSRKTVEAEGSKASSIEPQTPGDSLRSIGAAFLNSRNEIQSDKAKSKSDEIIGLPAKPHSGSRIHIQSPLRVANRVLDDLVEERRGSAELKQASPEQMDEAIGLVRSSSGLTTSMALQEITQSVERPPRDSARMPHMLLHHTRNNSLSTVQASSSQLATSASGSDTAIRRGIVRNKKSLPDLRQNAGIFASERSDNGDAGPSPASETAQRRKGSNASLERRPPLPKTSSESAALATRSNGSIGTDIWLSNASNTRVVLPGEIDLVGSVGLNGMQMGSVEAEGVEVERNSYFKRLSTLPASTISKSISVPVLQCVDATRGILYALSQMHSALKQYITFASDERTTSQLSRALDIASRSMGGLINSLDRFDSLSRSKGGSLDPHVVQGVLTSCSESVNTFRRIVSLLLLQLKALQDGADIRYTRTLLLLLFGSLAEIHHSWMVMEPLFKDVLPYLQGQSGTSTFPLASSATVPSLSAGGPYTLPSIAEATSPISGNNNGRLGTASTRPLRRRHAGSFSANDVAQGASMVPNVPLPIHGYEEIRKAQRPAALGPFPAPSRMGMYQVQQGDTDGGDLLDSNQLTPMAPLTPKESSRRIPEETSRRTLSNTSGGNMSAMSHIQGFHQAYPSDALEAAVDDHLVLLLVKITSIAYSVWASINDHLNSLGIPAASKGINKTSALMKTHQATPENTPFMGDQSFAASPHTSARALRVEGSSSSVTVMQDQQEENLSPENSTVPLPPQAAHLSSSIMNKLRHLRESINVIIDQTNKLESCCDKVQERSGIKSPTMINISIGSNSDPTFHNIFMESSSFIKAVISISHYIKGLSNEHQFPKSIKVNLAQLTTCARDLTLHLHFLGGSSASSKAAAAVAVSPKQQRLAVK